MSGFDPEQTETFRQPGLNETGNFFVQETEVASRIQKRPEDDRYARRLKLHIDSWL